jgi:hypothetical protein
MLDTRLGEGRGQHAHDNFGEVAQIARPLVEQRDEDVQQQVNRRRVFNRLLRPLGQDKETLNSAIDVLKG